MIIIIIIIIESKFRTIKTPLTQHQPLFYMDCHFQYEASYIPHWKPDLNGQKDFQSVVLCRNGIT